MLHTLTTRTMKKKRVGRGGHGGKNAGRGHKGQKSRAGRNIRPAMRDVVQRIPKKRGHNKNRARGVRTGIASSTVTLTMLSRHFGNKDVVSPAVLVQKGLVVRRGGKIPAIKIVASGDMTTALTIRGNCTVSAVAKDKIIKAGGTVR